MIDQQAADILFSKSRDPHFNLAVEEWLLRDCTRFTLLIYRNRSSIILGRNQNPWLECDLQYADNEGLDIARRISGGGTVYHDPGNSNFTFAMPRKMYEPTRFLDYAAQALETLGIAVRVTDRHNLFVDNAKVSGTAFMLTGRRAMQHGTLLINADLEKLRRGLRTTADKIETHAVASVPDEVANLSRFAPELSHDKFAENMYKVMERHAHSVTAQSIDQEDFTGNTQVQKYLTRQRDWEWVYGRTPAFIQTIAAEQTGLQPIRLTVRHGRIFAVDTPAPSRQAEQLQKQIGNRYPGTTITNECG